MTTRRDDITENDLHAYADGQLDATRRAEVEAWLETNPQAAADIAAWRAQNEAIRDVFGEAPRDAAADEAMIAGLSRRPARRARRFGIAAGFVLAFLAGGGAGALATASLEQREATRIAEILPAASKTNYLVYASEVRHPVEVGADEEAHLVGWLGKRLGRELTAPDMTAKGYHLVGGRLVPFAEKAGAMLMYENDGGDRVTVLIGTNPSHAGTGFQFAENDGVSTFFWTDGSFGYAMSGAVGREALLGLAHIVYAQY